MKAIVIMCVVALLAGCATRSPTTAELAQAPPAHVHAPQTTSSEPAKITVIRDVGMFGAAVFFHIELDGIRIASLNPGEWFTFRVDPGEHVLGVIPTDPFGAHKVKTIETIWRPNQSATYRVGGDGNGLSISRDPGAAVTP